MSIHSLTVFICLLMTVFRGIDDIYVVPVLSICQAMLIDDLTDDDVPFWKWKNGNSRYVYFRWKQIPTFCDMEARYVMQ